MFGPSDSSVSLSNDIFQLIAMYLSIPDIGHLLRTSKHIKTMVDSEHNWRIRCQMIMRGSELIDTLPPGYVTWKMFCKDGLFVCFDVDNVGGHVQVSGDWSRRAEFQSSYGTCMTKQSFTDGIHYCEVVMHFDTTYAGVGFVEIDTTDIPGPGRGAWLGPTGAHMWVASSGLWSNESHTSSASGDYGSGDAVGVLLDLRMEKRTAYWFLNGKYSKNQMPIRASPDSRISFCVCMGDGTSVIQKRVMPDNGELMKAISE